MDAQRIIEMLAEMIAEMNANHKEMMAKIGEKRTPSEQEQKPDKRKCWPECKKIHKPCEKK
jgi:hypothetical protein